MSVSDPGGLAFSLLLNAALLLCAVQIIDLTLARRRVDWIDQPSWMTGTAVGVIGVLLIGVSTKLMPGVIFDARSVLLALCGLFFGPLPTAIAVAMTGLYRWSIGGPAVWVGIAVILTSGALGVLWRTALRGSADSVRWGHLLALGLAVHAVMLALMLLLPREMAIAVLKRIALPVMLIHPLFTVTVGLLLVERLRRRSDIAQLREREARYHAMFADNHAVMLILDAGDGAIVDANPAAERFYGWPRCRLLSMCITDINTISPEACHAEMALAQQQRRGYFRFRHRLADGSLRDVEVYSGPIRVGTRNCLYSIVHDITERRAAEDGLRAMEESRRREQELALKQQVEGRRAALNLMEDAVTARRQAEITIAALRASETRNRSIVEYAQDLIIVSRADRVSYVNPAGLRLLRAASAAAVEGRAVIDLFDTEGRLEVRRLLERLHGTPGATTSPVTTRMLAFAGEPVDVDLRAVSYRSGKHIDVQLTCRDITERRRQDEALRESEERLNLFIDHAPAALAMFDRNMRYIAVSRRWLDDYGLQGREVIGQSHYEVFPEISETWKEVHRRGLAGEIVRAEEDRFVRAGGAAQWLRWEVRPWRNFDGKVGGIVIFSEDITERKRVEDNLRKLSQAVEQSSESIVITNLEPTIEYVNEAFLQVSGYSRDEILGRNPRILHSGNTPSSTFESLWEALTQGRVWSGEFHNRRKDGSEYIEAAVVSPLRQPDGTISHYVAVKKDITEHRRTEAELSRYRLHLEQLVAERTAQLQEAQRLAESANRAKSEFLANMSHEIRTPMNGVLGMLELLAQSRLTEQQAEMLVTARESGRTLLGIIDDILDFSKIEAGRLSVESVPTMIAEVVEGLCDAMVPAALRRDVDLSVYVDPRLPVLVLSDPLRLRQILFNLLGNAIKFSGGRTEMRGRVALRVTGTADPQPQLLFEVNDNGIGMTEPELARLFQPFTQAEASTTRRYGGTGLGLTVCKRLVDLMGGQIAVSSQPGEGSTFSVLLPCLPAAEQPDIGQPDLSGVDCIFFHSDAPEAELIADYLRYSGARVHFVATASEEGTVVSHCAGPVVVVRWAKHGHSPQFDCVGQAGSVRYLYITQGRRRHARIESDEIVVIDGTALRRLSLLRAVSVAAGRTAADAIHDASALTQTLPFGPLPAIDEARDRGQLVLVAEDDEVNRKVIRMQLELLGCAAELAVNGEEALNMWRTGRYGLILTDLHMPEMDGYALAASIRREEDERSRSGGTDLHQPIVALTANALRGEADFARASGFDDYLTKPLQLDELRRTLARWLFGRRIPGEVVQPSEATPARSTEAAVDTAFLKRELGSDAQVREMLALFRSTSTQTKLQLDAACEAGDLGRIRDLAHKLKGSAGAIGASALFEACNRLEAAAKCGDGSVVPTFAADVTAAMQRVDNEIRVILETVDG